jgi:hypothetical protein
MRNQPSEGISPPAGESKSQNDQGQPAQGNEAEAALADLFKEVALAETRPIVEYDLSFAYAFNWDQPEKQIKEALKVLLCNREGDSQPDGNATKAVKKRPQEKQFNTQAALEAAKIRWLLAINPNTPPPVLEHLTRNAPNSLLERIAENPRTHSTTLARLATHEDAQVRAAVAENMNTSIKTIWKLAKDEHPDVRMRVAESYTVPIAVLKVLAEDENPYVAHRAQRTVLRILKEVSELRTA